MISSLRIFMILAIFILFVPASGLAEQLKFRDWVGLEETDPATNQKIKKIGTRAQDGISSIWLSDSGPDTLQLILMSEKTISSDYYSYRIDRIDNLVIRSALKGCESSCLTDDVPKTGEFIKNMKRGIKLKLEYESDPDVGQKPTFSLKGFSRAYRWLVTEKL